MRLGLPLGRFVALLSAFMVPGFVPVAVAQMEFTYGSGGQIGVIHVPPGNPERIGCRPPVGHCRTLGWL